MENPLVFKILEEIRLQVRLAQIAQRGITPAAQSNDTDKAVFYAHGLLLHAMCVSRLLWPSAESGAERGRRLREVLKVEEESPLRLEAPRRQAEAYDERLVDWADQAEHRDFVAVNLMPVGTLEGFPEDKFHRSLDPESLSFSFEGISVDLRRVMRALAELDRVAESWLRKNNPW